MVRVHVNLDEQTHRALCALAKTRGCAVSALAREAIHRLLAEDIAKKLRTLDGITGLWRDRRDIGDTASYLRRLRRGRRRTGWRGD